MQVAGIHHVSINVDDLAAARSFYIERLGLVERTDRPDLDVEGTWLDIGGQQVHLIVADVPPRMGQHFAVRVADVDAAVADLREHGVRVSDPVVVGTGRQCFLRDPCGNTIEIHEVGGAARV